MRISDWSSDVCSSDLLKRFGGAFHKRFNSLLTRVDRYYIKQKGFSIVSSYGSLITCRHEFAHQGSIPETASYNDIKNGYEAGKVFLSCLAKAPNSPSLGIPPTVSCRQQWNVLTPLD